MTEFLAHTRLHATQQVRRHLNSPFVWLLALAGPVGARFLVPEETADYALIGVNEGVLQQSASVIGLQLGVIAAVLFAPLAYIFLRAGPTRIQPRQVTDVAPKARPALSLGRWLGDTIILWGLLLVLAVSGVMISFFRLPLSDVQPVETILAAMIIAAPAMAVIAAVRNIFVMRPGMRGAGGDVAFFIFWMAALILSAAFFMDGSGGSPFADLFGFAAPFAAGTSEPVTSLVIGGAPVTGKILEFDGLEGVTQPDYLVSRVFWIAIAGLLAASAGYIFRPGKPKRTKQRQRSDDGPATFSSDAIQSVIPTGSGRLAQIITNVRELITPHWYNGLMAAVAIAGFAFPLRGVIGPALVLLLIFPMTLYGARWRAKSIERWLGTLPGDTVSRVGLRLVSAVGFVTVLLVPSILALPSEQWGDIVAIAIGLPLLAVALGHLTRGPVAARLVLLILWYGYLNL